MTLIIWSISWYTCPSDSLNYWKAFSRYAIVERHFLCNALLIISPISLHTTMVSFM
ncbi:unnamed protein product [Leptidea sinapis]|uniref:Uncharacterized protein n=1 Tax=Leptidea sinapis TaxID=189913 RepID=A0A5E4QZZ3_9NEOP|nr:unnamed protein product [Leptidea sinapis]